MQDEYHENYLSTFCKSKGVAQCHKLCLKSQHHLVELDIDAQTAKYRDRIYDSLQQGAHALRFYLAHSDGNKSALEIICVEDSSSLSHIWSMCLYHYEAEEDAWEPEIRCRFDSVEPVGTFANPPNTFNWRSKIADNICAALEAHPEPKVTDLDDAV